MRFLQLERMYLNEAVFSVTTYDWSSEFVRRRCYKNLFLSSELLWENKLECLSPVIFHDSLILKAMTGLTLHSGKLQPYSRTLNKYEKLLKNGPAYFDIKLAAKKILHSIDLRCQRFKTFCSWPNDKISWGVSYI